MDNQNQDINLPNTVNSPCSPSNETSTIIDQQLIVSTNIENGYPVRQENGQRKTGPPPTWPTTKLPPGRGCEVFVGKLPRDCFESELFPIFERIGQIYEMRLMMDFSGFNRGYAFITFTQRDDAKRAVKELNNFEIRKGRLIGVCQSVDNCRLFVGGIPKTKKKEEILDEMCKVTDGVVDVIVYPSAHDKSKNRGFAFVEYESHRSAAMARRKLLPGKIQLWGHQIAVDWAEPEAEVDEDVMAMVRVLYVRNLMMTTSEEQIKDAFEKIKEGSVERVKKLKDYCFVHFKERDDALHAMHIMNGADLDGSIVEVTLAKPVDKNQYFRYTRGVSPATLAAATFGLTGTTQTIDIGPYAAIPYFASTIPVSPPLQAQTVAANAALTAAVNAMQQKYIIVLRAPPLLFEKLGTPENIRRCLNATGRVISTNPSNTVTGTNNNSNSISLITNDVNSQLSTSSPRTSTTSRQNSSSSSTLQPHRGAYYAILRPSSRRNPADEKCLEDLYKETHDALYCSSAAANLNGCGQQQLPATILPTVPATTSIINANVAASTSSFVAAAPTISPSPTSVYPSTIAIASNRFYNTEETAQFMPVGFHPSMFQQQPQIPLFPPQHQAQILLAQHHHGQQPVGLHHPQPQLPAGFTFSAPFLIDPSVHAAQATHQNGLFSYGYLA
ncbi:unnamed protein product [Didymodactylos carnosus]|uniref:RRM domain-containing protein n=1 Tax=Didymodactylos carnosus TaxID=1234261 RepID=A0A813YJZ0_9BILA|nr:unnamed protein product [Didymodactylos carnosus]CAF0885224.1 unnamed protein product [Didymodactylos carnosus]CAF3657140.1 unnamed protein product [Didymodactylos carnosus]CAF3670630.1 unnamed protein product [Didymodactylos carnosus]